VLCRQDFARNSLEAKIKFASVQLQSRQPACLLAIRNGGGEGGAVKDRPSMQESAYSFTAKFRGRKYSSSRFSQAQMHKCKNGASEERTTLTWLLIDYGI
jgi:hypothetical protein